jgi:hypothetical protein
MLRLDTPLLKDVQENPCCAPKISFKKSVFLPIEMRALVVLHFFVWFQTSRGTTPWTAGA